MEDNEIQEKKNEWINEFKEKKKKKWDPEEKNWASFAGERRNYCGTAGRLTVTALPAGHVSLLVALSLCKNLRALPLRNVIQRAPPRRRIMRYHWLIKCDITQIKKKETRRTTRRLRW